MNRKLTLEHALHSYQRKLSRLLDRAHRNPTEEEVHDLRVLVRRIRALIWFVPPRERKPKLRRAYKGLKKLGAALGEQRTYDVAIGDASFYHLPIHPLKRKCSKAKRHVRRALRPSKKRAYLHYLDQGIPTLHSLGIPSISPRIQLLCRELNDFSSHAPRGLKTRHRLRVQLKKARYLLEALAQVPFTLRRIQDHLGRWHDLTVLAHMTRGTSLLEKNARQEWKLAKTSLERTVTQTTKAISSLVA